MAYSYTWPRYNIIQNGGFESNTGTSPTGWTVGAGTPEAVATNPYTGSNSLEMDPGDEISQAIPIFQTTGTVSDGHWLSIDEPYLLTFFEVMEDATAGPEVAVVWASVSCFRRILNRRRPATMPPPAGRAAGAPTVFHRSCARY